MNWRQSFLALIVIPMIVPVIDVEAAPSRPVRPGTRLTIDEYLEQVGEGNQAFKAADQNARAARLTVSEGSLLYKPMLTGDASATGYATNNPFDKANDFSKTQSYSLGISEQTPIGLNGKISINQLNIESPSQGAYLTTYPKYEVSLSLYRNLLGAEVRSQANAIESASQAKAHAQSFQAKTVLMEAESHYWRLVMARELVEMQRDAVERAQKLHEWSSRRVKLQLSDRAETYATSTNLQARKLDLRTAEDDAREAALAFNASRGVLSDQVPERLLSLNAELVSRLKQASREEKRGDLKAAEFQALATAAGARANREKYKPTLEVFASGPFSDPGTPSNPALMSYMPPSMQPTTVVGVRLSTPLDIFSTYKIREGYAAEAQAADMVYQRKALEEERDWQNLSAKFRETRERLRLYTDLERTQRQKLDHERERQQRGRSTLQQVLIFENDFALAQMGRLRAFAELLTLNAQMKLYGANHESR